MTTEIHQFATALDAWRSLSSEKQQALKPILDERFRGLLLTPAGAHSVSGLKGLLQEIYQSIAGRSQTIPSGHQLLRRKQTQGLDSSNTSSDQYKLIWLDGKHYPRADYLKIICELLDCSADDLLGVEVKVRRNA